MAYLMAQNPWVIAISIFILRALNISMDTIRVLLMVRDRKIWVWILGFIQSAIFVIVFGSVLNDLDNPINLVMYSAGFATGNIAGMWLESRMALGHIQLSIVSSSLGPAIADQLRSHGFGVTEIAARGKNGTVTVLHCDVYRKDMDDVETIILETDPDAFITAEDVRPIRSGFWREK